MHAHTARYFDAIHTFLHNSYLLNQSIAPYILESFRLSFLHSFRTGSYIHIIIIKRINRKRQRARDKIRTQRTTNAKLSLMITHWAKRQSHKWNVGSWMACTISICGGFRLVPHTGYGIRECGKVGKSASKPQIYCQIHIYILTKCCDAVTFKFIPNGYDYCDTHEMMLNILDIYHFPFQLLKLPFKSQRNLCNLLPSLLISNFLVLIANVTIF